MKANRLKLNAKKTHIMTIGTSKRLSNLPRKLKVTMNNQTLIHSASGCESLLGCKVSTNLKWHNQVESLVSRLSKRLAGLRHLIYKCPFSVKKIVAEGIFTSLLVYCLPVFGGIDKGQLQKLQVLQNQAVRIVCRAPARAKRIDLYSKIGWLTVHQLVVYQTLIQVFKIRQKKEPKYLAKILCKETRSGRIMLDGSNLLLATNSFCFKGSSLWNSLPRSIRSIEKIDAFKARLREWIYENIAQFMD